MMIVYQNEDYVIINKPVGLDSEHELVKRLTEELGQEIFVVHRLDRMVGGLMVFALNRKMAGDLSAQLQNRLFEKEYVLVCEGEMEAEGLMEDLLFHDRKRNRSYVVDRKRNGVKEAALSFRLLERGAGVSLVRVHLHTGRTHQIRVQFASRKHPLVGDRAYGSRIKGSLALVSCHLSFIYNGLKVVYEYDCVEELKRGTEGFEGAD